VSATWGEGFEKKVEAAGRAFAWFSVFGVICLIVLLVLALQGCATPPTDVQTVPVPVVERCKADRVERPTWAVDGVQLTANPKLDLVLIERAKEAELEQRIAYESKLEAAVDKCR
jgi:hypothetical protein